MDPLTPLPQRAARRDPAAFSLIELIAVLAIMAILLALAAGMSGRIVSSNGLTSAAAELGAVLVDAQQEAITKNLQTEFRIYRYDTGEAGVGSRARAYQILHELPDGTLGVRQNAHVLAESLVFSDAENRSTLADAALQGLLTGMADSGHFAPADATGPVGYTAFRFFPDGSTSLPATTAPEREGDTWHLTIVEVATELTGDTSLPPNWATVRVAPRTGQVTRFRP